MNAILSSFSASVSELKRNPSHLLEASGGEAIAILNHNKPTAYLVPASAYEELLERLEDAELMEVAKQRQSEKDQAVEVSLDEL